MFTKFLKFFRVPSLWYRLQRLRKRWSFINSVGLLTGGTVTAQAINLLLAPIIARLYMPGDVGRLAVFISFVNIASVAVALRYELGIVSAKSNREAAALVLMAGVFTLPLSLGLATLLYFLIKHSILGFGAMPTYAAPLTLAALALTGSFTTLRYWMVRCERYSLISQATILQQGTRAVTQAALGLLGTSSAGLFAGELAGRASGMQRMFLDALPRLQKDLSGVSLSEIRGFLARNYKFPALCLPSSLIDAACVSMIVPLMVLQYGPETGGQFALTSRVLSVPLVLIATSVADVFHSRISINARQDPTSCSSLFWRTALGLLIIGSIPSLTAFLLGKYIFVLVFGKNWAFAGVLAAAMAPWFLFQFVVSPLSRLVLVLHGQEFKLVYDTLILCSVFIVFEGAKHYSWSALQTVHWLVALNTAAYSIYFFILVLVVRKASRDLSADKLVLDGPSDVVA